MTEIADAIQGTVADMFGAEPEVAPETADAPEAPAQVAEVETDSFPDWEAAGRDLFTDDDEDDAPDFTLEAEEPVASEDELAPTEFDDEATRQLKQRLLAERKKAEFYQRQHLKSSRKAWEADVRSQPWGQFLPPDLSAVKAPSHREFKRQARQLAKANYEVLKPHFDRLQSERARLAEIAKQEGRSQAAAAWGKPTVGVVPTGAPAEVAATRDALAEARAKRSMVGAVRALIDQGAI